MRAQKIGKKAACFDFPNAESVTEKVYEELDELKEAVASGNEEAVFEEMGDLLLTITSLCRKIGVDAELSLSKATEKFIARFEQVENVVLTENKNIDELSMVELDAIWEKNKKNS